MFEYGKHNLYGEKYVLIVIDDFSNYEWGVPLKSKNHQNITNCFSKNFFKNF